MIYILPKSLLPRESISYRKLKRISKYRHFKLNVVRFTISVIVVLFCINFLLISILGKKFLREECLQTEHLFLLKIQLLLKHWSDFAHFFSNHEPYLSPWSEVICEILMHKARRRFVFSSIHMNCFISNFICCNDLNFSGLLSSLIFISYTSQFKYIT